MKVPCAVVLLAVAVVSACSKKESSPTTPTTCAYTLASTSQAPPAGGGTFTIGITKTAGSCTWAATSNASWITFSGSSSGTDTGTLTLVIAPNDTTSVRSGTITVTWNGGTAQIAVNQAGLAFGECTYSFVSSSQTVPVEGGSSSAALAVTGSGCTWNAASDAPWLTITSGTSGTTSTAIAFTAAANPDAVPRTASITVTYPGGTTRVTITQAGVAACIYTLSPSSQTVPAAGGTFNFVPTRNTPNGCSWAASTTTPWITLNGPTTGLSGTPVSYTVMANGSGSTRSGAITLTWSGGTADFAVTQTP